jgi:pyrrolidone-carboxylate peptidase
MKLSLLFFSAMLAGACAAPTDDDGSAAGEDAVVVDTSDPLSRAQYDADVAFAKGYVPTCTKPEGSTRPRVIVTGFGRFHAISDNATGHILERVVPGLIYPKTNVPPDGQVDPPGPQTVVKLSTMTLPGAGEVDVCGMIVPVYWDLAAILIAREVETFEPSMVMMDGVDSDRQPLLLELGSVNRAETSSDGSGLLTPVVPAGRDDAPIIRSAPASDQEKGLLLSYEAVRAAAKAAIDAKADVVEGDKKVPEILQGAKLAGFPRSVNTYLCNNISYILNYLMSYPGKSVTLLKPSMGPLDGVHV